jgi:malate dehydrogenase (oxaloacetate-decarboxylating)(NADP+)
MSAADVPSMLATTIELILKTLPLDAAFDASIGARKAPDSPVAGKANCFIFPDLNAGNIAYKLLQETGGAEAIGPVLLGLKKSAHVLQLGSSVREIVNMLIIAVVDAQSKQGN